MQRRLDEYVEELCDIDAARIIWLDETGLNLSMLRRRGWAPRGQRLYDSVPFRSPHRVTLLAALSLEGSMAEIAFEGYLSTRLFVDWVRDYLVPELFPGDVVIMDNLKIHKVLEVRRLIEAAGCRVVFLPPYMPHLNPIEYCWSKLKGLIRALKPRTFEELVAAVRNAIKLITEEDSAGWISHCGLLEALHN